jgi:hypothetical protein
VFKSVVGVRNLKAIIAEASSARVLDLVSLSIDPPSEGDYVERPLFHHPVLNRTIIVKHNVASTEEDPLAPRRLGATKVIFPFDPADLDLGGQYLFVDQPDFIAALTRHLDYGELPLERDVQVLRLLDKLPTLDPFLIRGILAQQKIDVGRCYHRLTEHDRADMLSFVIGEMEALIQLCFGAPKTDDTRAKRLAERLLGEEDSPELAVLREALRMSPEEFSEAMFTWKAFLYYRWRARELTPQVKATLQAFTRIRARRFERDELSFVMRCRDLVQRTVIGLLDDVNQRLRHYDEAFGAFTGDGDPGRFRLFLARGAGLELGTRIGRLEQLVSFWRQRFGKQPISAMSPDDIIDGLRDLLQGLSISPLSDALSQPFAEGELRSAVA